LNCSLGLNIRSLGFLVKYFRFLIIAYDVKIIFSF